VEYRSDVANALGELAGSRVSRSQGIERLAEAMYGFLYTHPGDELPRGGIDFLDILEVTRRKRFSWLVSGTASFLTDNARDHLDFLFEARLEPDLEFGDLRSYEISFGTRPRRTESPVWLHRMRHPESPAA
jgi:hypothetical protein